MTNNSGATKLDVERRNREKTSKIYTQPRKENSVVTVLYLQRARVLQAISWLLGHPLASAPGGTRFMFSHVYFARELLLRLLYTPALIAPAADTASKASHKIRLLLSPV